MKVISSLMNNKKIKLLFLVPQIENCGPINVVLNIVLNLDLSKFDIMVASVRSVGNEYYKKFLPYCSLGIVTIGSIHALEEVVKDIDVIHSHGFYPDKMVASLKNKKIKKITTIHCMLFKDYVQEYGLFKGVLGALFHLSYIRKNNFSYIVACSNTVKEYLSRYVSNESLININNGVNQEVFIPIDFEEKESRKKEYGLSNKRIFIFAGRMIRRKQVPELISFFMEKMGGDKNNILLILGDGEEMQKCKDLANEQIRFIGMVNNPEYYYQLSDYVLSMSNAEGYPMSILEAVSCGCYAYLSDIPSHKEFIQKNSLCADYITNISTQVNHNRYKIEQLSAKLMAEKYELLYLERLQ